ncbi:hypothetical protein V8C86DRAFT_3135151 [Haematococcus lacustris]
MHQYHQRAPAPSPCSPVAAFYSISATQPGLRSSCGIMVNYQYQPDTMDANNEGYLVKKQIQAAGQVRALLATSDHA